METHLQLKQSLLESETLNEMNFSKAKHLETF